MSSFSGLSDFQRCPTLFRYRNILNLEPKHMSSALFEGIGAHEMFKVWFLALQAGASEGEAWAAVLHEYDALLSRSTEQMFADELAEAEKLLDEALYIVQHYINNYKEDWEILHVEEEFTMEVEGYYISFTPDLVVRDRNGFIWIVDHKTTSRLPKHGLPFGDLQHVLYYAGLKPVYPELRGFIFNKVRKKIPTKPRLNKTGKTAINNLNRIDTTYEVLRDFLLENAPNLIGEPSHARRLAELRDQPDRFFWTETVYVSDEQADAAINDAVWTEYLIETSEQSDYYPRTLREDNGWSACSRCAFAQLCSADLLDSNAELVLAEFYQQRPPKNPYEGEQDDDT
jgi:hypothetical protein